MMGSHWQAELKRARLDTPWQNMLKDKRIYEDDPNYICRQNMLKDKRYEDHPNYYKRLDWILTKYAECRHSWLYTWDGFQTLTIALDWGWLKRTSKIQTRLSLRFIEGAAAVERESTDVVVGGLNFTNTKCIYFIHMCVVQICISFYPYPYCRFIQPMMYFLLALTIINTKKESSSKTNNKFSIA